MGAGTAEASPHIPADRGFPILILWVQTQIWFKCDITTSAHWRSSLYLGTNMEKLALHKLLPARLEDMHLQGIILLKHPGSVKSVSAIFSAKMSCQVLMVPPGAGEEAVAKPVVQACSF